MLDLQWGLDDAVCKWAGFDVPRPGWGEMEVCVRRADKRVRSLDCVVGARMMAIIRMKVVVMVSRTKSLRPRKNVIRLLSGSGFTLVLFDSIFFLVKLT